MLSCMGSKHARILVAHHDGVIRRSGLYDLSWKNVEALRLFVRWWCSDPVGETRSV